MENIIFEEMSHYDLYVNMIIKFSQIEKKEKKINNKKKELLKEHSYENLSYLIIDFVNYTYIKMVLDDLVL